MGRAKTQTKSRPSNVQRAAETQTPAKQAGPARTPPARLARQARDEAPAGVANRAHAVRRMQQTAGNQRTTQMLADPPQPGPEPAALTVSRREDPAEREAESIARQVAAGRQAPPVTATPPAPQAVHRQAVPDEPDTQQDVDVPPVQTLQRQPRGSALDTPSAARAIQQAGPGRPMQRETRRVLESRMGADLSAAKVHDDSRAHAAADALNARAFAQGNDIYLGRGESEGDVSLMAHEAAHTLQQAGGTLQRAENESGAGASSTGGDSNGPAEIAPGVVRTPDGAVIDENHHEMKLPALSVPKFKETFYPSGMLRIPRKQGKRETRQREIWDQAARTSALEERLRAKLAPQQNLQREGADAYFLLIPGARNYVIGDFNSVRDRTLRPYWDKRGAREFFHVDHRVEIQTGGPDELGNLWLLQDKANMSSGKRIHDEIKERVTKARGDAGDLLTSTPTDYEAIRAQYQFLFERVEGGLSVTGEPRKTWNLAEISEGRQIDPLHVMTVDEIARAGLRGTPEKLAVYTNRTGGGLYLIPWGAEAGTAERNMPLAKNFTLHQATFTPEQKSIRGIAFENNKYVKPVELGWPLLPMPGVQHGGYISRESVTESLQNAGLEVKGASPVEITQAELRPQTGIYAVGRLKPTIPLIGNADIDLVINGAEIYLQKTFTADEFSFPGPVQVTDATLTLMAGTQGLAANGQVNFEVPRLGTGHIAAAAATRNGGTFELEGRFDFDTDLFDPASISAWYRDGTFGASGELRIPDGKVRGIKGARIAATVDGDRWQATGTVQPAIPGVDQGELGLAYSPETGMVVSGTLTLTDQAPGLKGGSLQATVRRREEGEGWMVEASGQAQLDIPGIDATVAVTYSDGAFLAEGTIAYERGMLSGTLTAGATNMPVGPDGRPQGPPTDQLTVFGGGAVTVRLTPWLQGTGGIRFLPNGEVEMTGSIGLPESVDLFPAKRFDRNLLNIGLDIPLLGVAAAGQRVGIFLRIAGGLDLSAGIGPGRLERLQLTVTYNPDREQETSIQGTGRFVVPADAGLRLFISGSLGAGIPIVSAQAGIELGGQLGIAGALEAGVDVNWTPGTGLVLDAVAEIYGEPKFKFDITGFVLVELDLLLGSIELYSERWSLASVEYGSGMRLGLKMPLHYAEGEPFDPSLEDIEFQKPDINPREVLSGLIEQIV